MLVFTLTLFVLSDYFAPLYLNPGVGSCVTVGTNQSTNTAHWETLVTVFTASASTRTRGASYHDQCTQLYNCHIKPQIIKE